METPHRVAVIAAIGSIGPRAKSSAALLMPLLLDARFEVCDAGWKTLPQLDPKWHDLPAAEELFPKLHFAYANSYGDNARRRILLQAYAQTARDYSRGGVLRTLLWIYANSDSEAGLAYQLMQGAVEPRRELRQIYGQEQPFEVLLRAGLTQGTLERRPELRGTSGVREEFDFPTLPNRLTSSPLDDLASAYAKNLANEWSSYELARSAVSEYYQKHRPSGSLHRPSDSLLVPKPNPYSISPDLDEREPPSPNRGPILRTIQVLKWLGPNAKVAIPTLTKISQAFDPEISKSAKELLAELQPAGIFSPFFGP